VNPSKNQCANGVNYGSDSDGSYYYTTMKICPHHSPPVLLDSALNHTFDFNFVIHLRRLVCKGLGRFKSGGKLNGTSFALLAPSPADPQPVLIGVVMTTQKIVWSLLLSGAVVTAACGDSKSLNPVAPSAVVVDGPQNEGASSAVSGPQAKGGIPGPPDDKGKDKDKQPAGKAPTNTSPSAPGLKKVEIEGLISAKGGDSITVNAQQVVVPATCPIRHGQTQFAFSDLKVGDRVHVRADRTSVEGAVVVTTTLRATEVILQNPGDGEGSGTDTPTTLVSVTATDGFASESPVDTGTFTLTRSGSAASLTTPLTVTYTVGGTALSPGDYTALSGSATFLAGQATVTVGVTPVADGAVEGAESVILTVTDSASYDLGAPASATVMITDTNTPLVSVTAFISTTSEQSQTPGRFRFTRSGSTTSSLTVTFTVSGTATSGVDYTALPVSVTFAAGSATADVPVAALHDSVNGEADETVTVTVTDGATYDVGAPASATVTILG